MFPELPNSNLFEFLPKDLLRVIYSDYLSFQDLIHLALTEKMGEIWANAEFELMATELKCSGSTLKERKWELAKMLQDLSPTFMRSVHTDIDKIRGRTFENGSLTVEYERGNPTAYFLICCAEDMLDQVSGWEEIIKKHKKTLFDFKAESLSHILIEQTPFNSFDFIGFDGIPLSTLHNTIDTKFLEVIKKSSEICFAKSCDLIKASYLNKEKTPFKIEEIEKYKNPHAIIIDNKLEDKFYYMHFLIETMFKVCNLSDRITLLEADHVTCAYGEKEDIQKFMRIIFAQQTTSSPTIETLRQACKFAQVS